MSYFDKKWRLASCRVDAGFTQVEVAKLIGVSEVAVVKWETGKMSPSMENAQKLSALYQMPLAYMDFTKEGNATPLRDREEYDSPLF